MRPFYFLLKVSLNISFRLFYKRFIVLRKHKKLFGSTVYVSNHPNSFMDPIMIDIMFELRGLVGSLVLMP